MNQQTIAILAITGTAVGSWGSFLALLGKGVGKIVNASRDLTQATHLNTSAVQKLTETTDDHARRIRNLELQRRTDVR